MATQYKYGSGGGGVGRVTAQKAADKQKKKQSPGVLMRVLDVLSRGNYAMANAISRENQADGGKSGTINAGAFIKGFGEGLTGKKKTTFSDVLAEKGMGGGAGRTALGFGLDILLDPTTYLGVGVAKTGAQAAGKGVTKVAAKGAAKGVAKDTLSTGARAIVEARKLEKAADLAGGAAKGGSTLWKPGMEVAQGAGKAAVRTADELEDEAAKLLTMAKKSKNPVAREAMEDEASRILRTAKDARKAGPISTSVLSKAPEAAQVAVKASESAAPVGVRAAEAALPGAVSKGSISLKVMGKPVIQSERAYAAASKVLSPIAKSQVGDLVGRTFRTAHGLPQAIRNLERKSHGVGMQDLHDQLLDIKQVFAGTTKAQRREIGAAVARGSVDSLDDTLRPLGEYAQKHMDELGSREGLGPTSPPGAKLFDDEPLTVAKKGKRGAPDEILPSQADDIADTLAKGYDKHLTKRAYQDFRSAVEKQFPEAATDPEMKRLLDRTEKVFAPGTPEGKEWSNLIDKVQGYWKMAVTAPNPGFHIRNMLGDTYLNYLDGVVNPNVYKRAVGVLRKTDGIAVRGGGQTLSNADVMRLYREQGLHSKFAQTENLVGGTSSRVLDKVGELSNAREDMGRVAHFIDALGKELRHGRKLDDAVDAAAERVRKFNIDYSDMTEMERKFKRIMPFYTFARKALPVQLEMTLTRPGRVAVLPKGQQAIERLIGVREEGDQSPLPGIDENLPPWMRDYFNISMGNNRVRSPDLPIDLLGQYANPVKGVMSGISPFIKAPIELGTGKTVPEGFAQKSSVPRYVMNQTPISRQVANYIWKDDDAVEKTGRWAVGPLASKVVTAPSTRKKEAAKKGGKKSTASSGSYRYGSR